MKFRRKQRSDEQPGGEDAFLDIVANLVGILVILVMVIGVRAQDAWVESAEKQTEPEAQPEPPPPELVAQFDRAATQHASLEANVHEVARKIEELETLAAIRGQERHELKVLLNAARRELDEDRKLLDEASQLQVAYATERDELLAEIDLVESQRRIVEAADQPIELEHLPTPLARTVFGAEEHFRLKHGKIAYVPLNELTDLLRRHAPGQVNRLSQVPVIEETLGPIQGFHLTYVMRRRNVETSTGVGAVTRQVAELERFVLQPMDDQIGEGLSLALKSDSQFSQLVETFREGATVVTVWTYPDSFAEFRQLKKWLFDRGFSAAARPLPADQPISGSPRGSRSAAQ